MDPPRRRSIDPLGVFVVLVLLAILVLVGSVVSGSGASKAPAPASAPPPNPPAPLAALPPAEILETLEHRPVTTKKGQLLKSEIKKKAERDAARLKATRLAAVAPSGQATELVLKGDAGLRRAFKQHLRGVRVVDDGARGFQLSLRVDTGAGAKGAVFAKCSAAIAELPNRKLVASLSARADAGGDGGNDDELQAAAMDACARSLADDVSKWLRAHP